MSWGADPFPDSDEAELLAQFVKYCAKYPKSVPIEVAQYVFEKNNLVDAVSRGIQWGTIWSNRLEVKEAISEARLKGEEPKVLTTEEIQREVLALARDNLIPPAEKKARIEAYELAAKIAGLLQKPRDPAAGNGRVAMPTIQFRPVDAS